MIRRTSLIACLLAASMSGCGSDATDPAPVVAAVTAVTSFTENPIAGDEVPVAVRVTEADGTPVEGAQVSWSVSMGESEISPTTQSNSQGIASNRWILDGRVGSHRLTATVQGLPSVTFEIEAVAGPLAQIDPQQDTLYLSWPGDTLSMPLFTADRFGNEVTPASLTWTIADETVATVDSDGLVTAVAEGTTTMAVSGGDASAEITVVMSTPTISIPMLDTDSVYDFSPFGIPLSSTQLNVAYEFYTDSPTVPVVAVVTARVYLIGDQPETGDKEILMSIDGSAWYVDYDHVQNVTVEVGDLVEAGTVLGTVGPWQVTPEHLAGRTELQIGYGDWVVCPALLGTAEFNAPHEELATRLGAEGVCVMERILQ